MSTFPPSIPPILDLDRSKLIDWLAARPERVFRRFSPTESALASFIVEALGHHNVRVSCRPRMPAVITIDLEQFALPGWAWEFECECDVRPNGVDDWGLTQPMYLSGAQALDCLARLPTPVLQYREA